MATIKEIVYSILNTQAGGRLSKDNPLAERLVKFWVQSYRGVFFKRSVEKHGTISPEWEQSLGVLALERADKSEHATFPTGMKFLRTVETLPKFLRMSNGDPAITFVGSIDQETSFELITPDRMVFVPYDKFTYSPYAFYLKNRIYLNEDCNLFKINLRGVPEDPITLHNFSNVEGESCFDEDTDIYPVPTDYIPLIEEEIINKKIKPLLGLGMDKDNDASSLKQPDIKG